MDSIAPEAGRGRIQAARVRQAGLEAGIGPDSPLAPFVDAVAQATEAITRAPGELDLRIAPALAEMRAATAAIEKAPNRPAEVAFTDRQIDDVGRRLLGACQAWSAGLVRASLWKSWAALAATVLVAVVLGFGAGWWLGSSREADKYVQVPASLGVALTGQEAAQWVNLIRLNDISRANRICAEQAGGMACSISLWTKPSAARAN